MLIYIIWATHICNSCALQYLCATLDYSCGSGQNICQKCFQSVPILDSRSYRLCWGKGRRKDKKIYIQKTKIKIKEILLAIVESQKWIAVANRVSSDATAEGDNLFLPSNQLSWQELSSHLTANASGVQWKSSLPRLAENHKLACQILIGWIHRSKLSLHASTLFSKNVGYCESWSYNLFLWETIRCYYEYLTVSVKIDASHMTKKLILAT